MIARQTASCFFNSQMIMEQFQPGGLSVCAGELKYIELSGAAGSILISVKILY